MILLWKRLMTCYTLQNIRSKNTTILNHLSYSKCAWTQHKNFLSSSRNITLTFSTSTISYTILNLVGNSLWDADNLKYFISIIGNVISIYVFTYILLPCYSQIKLLVLSRKICKYLHCTFAVIILGSDVNARIWLDTLVEEIDPA